MNLLLRAGIVLIPLGLWSSLFKNLASAERASLWPEGQYGLPKPIDGCPKSNLFTWETGSIFQDCEDTNPKTSKSPSYHLAGFVNNDVLQEFCVKTDTINDSANLPWPAGQYCIYQKGNVCPQGLESGWVVWDDESEVIGNNKNAWNGTLPKGKYDRDTKMYFCCSTKGRKTKKIDLPLSSPFFLIAYRDSSCQQVRGATATREFIYYETEYYTRVTKNDYGGVYPYRVTRSRYGHTIYYCYYRPNYCPPLSNVVNGHVYPPRCIQANSNVFNDTCVARCNPGYVPRVSGTSVSVCSEDGRWNSTSTVTCLPKTTTNLPTTRRSTTSTKQPSYTSNTSEQPAIKLKPLTKIKVDILTTTRTNIQADYSTWKPLASSTKDGLEDFGTETLAEDQFMELSSVGRIVAGAISGAIVVFGVVFIISVSHCRRRNSKNKEKERKRALGKSKSLEELVAGRRMIQRTVSEENLIFADPVSCQVEYTVKTDENPLYESFDCSTLSNPPNRMADNVLYESVSPLLPSSTTIEQNEPPPYCYQPTTL